MQEKLYLYPKWVRLWHLVNALLCILLIITGLSMQYAGVEYYLMRFD
ncbi:MAG: cytochrome b/b6 domain-containing protein, partial [Saprospiraceae bacterium]|nr:cytochrome b/b6 domain-containing protein [Saprospiraceae bacterium]